MKLFIKILLFVMVVPVVNETSATRSCIRSVGRIENQHFIANKVIMKDKIGQP